MDNFWSRVENISNEKFPPCVVKLLEECGYIHSSTITKFTLDDIEQLEVYIDTNLRSIIEELKCCNASSYKSQQRFKFLPGHRKFILSLKDRISLLDKCESDDKTPKLNHKVPRLLQLLNENVERNTDRAPTCLRHHRNIRDFASYLHMICGKLCYEFLSKNLPLPQSSTVRKYIPTFGRIRTFLRT